MKETKKDRLTERILFRVTPQERALLKTAAEFDNRKLSSFIRTYLVRVSKRLLLERKQLEVLDGSKQIFDFFKNIKDMNNEEQ